MVRGALWLLQVVGEGNTFTKNELREAFPKVSQIDRRIRDLRDYQWVVYSSTEDASLLAEDQRFVQAGVPVWDPKARREAAPQKAITAKERQRILARDNYSCVLCGISGSETYPDDTVMTAVLAISRCTTLDLHGQETETLVTECKRCRAGGSHTPATVDEAIAAAAELDVSELRRLRRWVERRRRGTTPLDRAWSTYLRVDPDTRPEVAQHLQELQQTIPPHAPT